VFEVIYDKNAGLTESERELKYNTTMKMYDLTQGLAYLVYELDAVQEAIKTSKKLYTSFENLKKTLVVTTGDNYVGSAEPQLREKMSDLYSKLASSYDKPSNAELDYLKLIENRFEKAKIDLEKLKMKAKVNIPLKNLVEFINE